MAEQNQPVKKFRTGGISASVWRNESRQQGQASYSVTFGKRYRDQDGTWKDSYSFFVRDLPGLELVIRKAYEYLALATEEEGNGDREF